MALIPYGTVCKIAKSTAAMLFVGACGASMVWAGSTGPFAAAGASFVGSVLGNAAFDRVQKFIAACKERPPERVDENHVILRALRHSQLEALTQLRARWNTDHFAEWGNRTAADMKFDRLLGRYLDEQTAQADSLTWDAMPDPSDDDLVPLRPLAAAFDFALALRHGVGLALDQIRAPVEGAVWAELTGAVEDSAPDNFKASFAAQQSGFFALFIAAAAARLRDNAEFERIWNAEQVATILHLSGETLKAVGDLEPQVKAATKALKELGALLGALAGHAERMDTATDDIIATLRGDRRWLRFDIKIATEGWLRFSPYNPTVPFLGRSEPLAALDAFLSDDRPFAWWGVTGPGGAGKSRLALELCLRARSRGWRVGFLRKAAVPPSGWTPAAPTLVIADYAAEHVGNVRSTAEALAELDDPKAPVVRLLLLERQIDDQFRQAFLGAKMSEAGLLTGCRYQADMLALPPLSDDELWNLVRSRPWQADATPLRVDRATFFWRFQEVDRHRRALVAMLLADAPDLGGDLADVLREFIRRGRDFWPKPMPDDADLLIATATLLGRLEGEMLTTLGRRLGRILTAEHDLHPCARAIGTPAYDEAQRLDGVEPDLIGEFFALETLAGKAPDPPPYSWLPEACWRFSPDRMAAFAARAFNNFPAHRAIPVLTTTPAADPNVAAAFLRMTWTVSAFESGQIPWTALDSLVRRAQAIDPAMHDAQDVRTALSATLYNTLNHAKAEGDTTRRDTMLADLRALAEAWPDDAAVREPLAMGLVNTLSHAKDEGDTARRDQLLADLRALAAAWPDDAAVRERLARGLFNTLLDAKDEGDTARRDTMLADLRALAEAWPDDAAVRERLAGGLFNTLIDAKAEGDTARRDTMLADLRALAEAWPDDAAVRERLAGGLLNTLNHAKAEGDTARRDTMLADLRALAEAWPDDAAVRERLAKGLVNTMIDAKAEGDTARRDTMLADLRALAEAWPDDAAVRERLGKGLTLRVLGALEEDNLPLADALLAELAGLAEHHPAQTILQELHAIARQARDAGLA